MPVTCRQLFHKGGRQNIIDDCPSNEGGNLNSGIRDVQCQIRRCTHQALEPLLHLEPADGLHGTACVSCMQCSTPAGTRVWLLTYIPTQTRQLSAHAGTTI